MIVMVFHAILAWVVDDHPTSLIYLAWHHINYRKLSTSREPINRQCYALHEAKLLDTFEAKC